MLRLNKLQSLVKKRKVVGRGGDRGGTSGRGHKGQKARSGGSPRRGFEGGQMPKYRRLPKRGFNNVMFETHYEIVNLSDLDRVFENGQIVNSQSLLEHGLIKPGKAAAAKCYIKVLGNGSLTKKLEVQAHRFSTTAQSAIEKVGGTVALLVRAEDAIAELAKTKRR
jgi:large subunit ribosomal protein L15